MFYSVRSENVKLKIAFTDDIDGVLHRFLYLLVKISPIGEFQTKERASRFNKTFDDFQLIFRKVSYKKGLSFETSS